MKKKIENARIEGKCKQQIIYRSDNEIYRHFLRKSTTIGARIFPSAIISIWKREENHTENNRSRDGTRTNQRSKSAKCDNLDRERREAFEKSNEWDEKCHNYKVRRKTWSSMCRGFTFVVSSVIIASVSLVKVSAWETEASFRSSRYFLRIANACERVNFPLYRSERSLTGSHVIYALRADSKPSGSTSVWEIFSDTKIVRDWIVGSRSSAWVVVRRITLSWGGSSRIFRSAFIPAISAVSISRKT